MKLEINTDILKSDYNSLVNKLNSINDIMDKMSGAIDELNGMWEGQSKNAFVTQYKSDYDNMMSLCNILKEFIECINFAVNKYNQCDRDVKNAINSLKV